MSNVARFVDLQRSVKALSAAGMTMAEAMQALGDAARYATRPLGRLRIAFDRPVLVIVDPASRWPGSARELLVQMRDVVLHEFWCGASRPERSPGARWIRKTDVGAGR